MNKILLVICTLLSIGSMAKITGPKYNFDYKIGLMLVDTYKPKIDNEKKEVTLEKEKPLLALTNTLSYSIIFKKDLVTKSTLTFGPKISLNVHLKPEINVKYIGGALLGQGVLGYEHSLKEKLKLFTELETGLGIDVSKGNNYNSLFTKEKQEKIKKQFDKIEASKPKEDAPAKKEQNIDFLKQSLKKEIEDSYKSNKEKLAIKLAYNVLATIGINYRGIKAGLYGGYGINGIVGTSLAYEF